MNTMNKKLRKEVLANDVETVREIVKGTGFFNEEETAIAAELVTETLEKGKAAGYEYIFLESDGLMLAYSCFGRIPLTRSSFDLYWIVTRNEYRNTGLGKMLLAETEKTIKYMGGTAIYAETSSREQYNPTRAFYEKNAYLPMARFKDYYDFGDDLVIYVKRLETA
jgi:GNAT superfamily N-acetyltransferase